jgi:hypothetical protein
MGDEPIETIPDHVLFREVDGEAILFDLAGGGYFSLDGVGARVWALLVAGATQDVIVATLLEEYDVEELVLREDVESLLDDLRVRGLIEATGSAAR